MESTGIMMTGRDGFERLAHTFHTARATELVGRTSSAVR